VRKDGLSDEGIERMLSEAEEFKDQDEMEKGKQHEMSLEACNL
jgi:molecular chaperone DnaK (HSP70)